ncbi:hypothetical protein BGZ70_001934 [Mortierella alpina]|uniref:GYF domain-containing protein n=1 Tax=Mortierella alpina TaxID=64518 RepID=A0A9P6M5Q1_MORAP|nr:hypothetical protein BGZ70_001934 [Mortierella alpina]
MASNTMNFGPEWMRRFPAKSSQSQTDLQARAPPPAAPPLQDWNQPAPAASATLPAFSYSSIAASNVRSQNGASGAASAQDSAAVDGGMGGNGASGSSSFATDSLNPFKYSKELMLSLYKPTGLPIEFEQYEIMTSEESLKPMSSQPFSDQEQKRNFDSRSHGVGGARPRSEFEIGGSMMQVLNTSSTLEALRKRHLNNDGRSHSFRRTDPVEREREREREREPEDGLWNSPVSNLLGSFDANGVFRVVGEGDELEPLAALEETVPEPALEETGGAATTIDDQLATNSAHGAPFQQSGAQDNSSLFERLHQEPYDDKDDLHQFSSAMNSSATLRSSMLHDNDDDLPSFSSHLPSMAALAHAPASSLEPIFDPAVELSKWLYRDPSGSVQGPFLSEEMHEWYKGGFFSPDLLVKREQDQTFKPLGSLVRRVGSDDQPFLTAGVVHQEPPQQLSAAGVRPTVPALAQNRQPQSQPSQPSGWIGMSAPTTPSTPSFGVDRLFMQQQQHQHQQQLQQQHSSGDLFGSHIGLGPQRSGFGAAQDPVTSGIVGMPGLDSRWSTGPFGRSQTVESNAGWAGDAFPRGPSTSMPAPHTPLGGPQYMEQQQRLHHQEIERQQYMQLLQRQSQMQAMQHQQQFMAAQQQFGNDPHALAALLAQQQAQQRQLQMRYQQLQYGALHGQDQPLTPGGTAIPWGRMGQPSSPWTTSIIPTSSDNYFDLNKGDEHQVPHSLQSHQEPPQFHQQAPSHVHQEQPQNLPQHVHGEDPMNSLPNKGGQHVQEQYDDRRDDDTVASRLQSLDIRDNSTHAQDSPVATEEVHRASPPATPAVETQKAVEHGLSVDAWFQLHGALRDDESNDTEDTILQPHAGPESWQDNREEPESREESVLEAASWSAAEPSRPTKAAAPAPWAKSTNAEGESSSEKSALTLREIQKMEAKRAETAKAERQERAASAAALSGHNNFADFTKGMAGSPAWSSTAPATPKKKTLKEIQQEEEAAMKRARAAAHKSHPSGAATGSTGLAAIVASGTGSIGKRYADTVGPRPTAVTATSGPWGSSAPNSAGAAKPALVTRSSAVFSSNPSLNSPTASVSRGPDTNSWIEVGSSKRDSAHVNTGSASHATSRPSSMVSHSAPSHSANSVLNSNEPRPVSEDFMRWCRQALKGLQAGVVLEDFIQMLLTFPLNPDPSTVEIIQDSIYANSQSLNGRQFADEFIKRRKADAYPNGGAPASASGSSTGNLASSGSGASDSSSRWCPRTA